MSPYLRKLAAIYAAGGLRRGEVHRIDVLHDGGCPRLNGGPCRCAPDVLVNGQKVEVPTA